MLSVITLSVVVALSIGKARLARHINTPIIRSSMKTMQDKVLTVALKLRFTSVNAEVTKSSIKIHHKHFKSICFSASNKCLLRLRGVKKLYT